MLTESLGTGQHSSLSPPLHSYERLSPPFRASSTALNAVNSSGTKIHKTAAVASAGRPPCKRIISTARHTDCTSSDGARGSSETAAGHRQAVTQHRDFTDSEAQRLLRHSRNLRRIHANVEGDTLQHIDTGWLQGLVGSELVTQHSFV